MKELASTSLFGVSITTETESNILKYILENLRAKHDKGMIFTPNPEIIMFARSHPEFRKILNEAKVNLPDGVGVTTALKFLGVSLNGRITGVDLVEKICKAVSEYNSSLSKDLKKPLSVGFFGGRANVAKVTAECLQKKYSGLDISYADSKWDQVKIRQASLFATQKVEGNTIDILFVAMGFPRQEKWISENIDKIPVTMAMGVGGAFDFIGGFVPRAPKFLRTIGLEWFFRLFIQPWRIKRQVQLIPFVLLVLGEFFKIRIFGKKRVGRV